LRTEIVVADLKLWTENPVLGVGVGEGEFQRDLEKDTATHTEYTGLLAEHGMLGLVAIGCLIGMALTAWRRQKTVDGRFISLALMVWSLATMTHLAVRLAIIPFAFAFAAAAVLPRPSTTPDPQPVDEKARADRP
jgi:O-antigen ligase